MELLGIILLIIFIACLFSKDKDTRDATKSYAKSGSFAHFIVTLIKSILR